MKGPGKPSGSIACTRKQQPRFYWSCSSLVMNDATPPRPLAHKRSSIFKCKQHTCTLHDPWGPENITTHNKLIETNKLHSCKQYILGYPGVIPLATSTPGTISWISFDLPLNEYCHFISFILIFGQARWPMKTIYVWERL